jgi:hypothetical protein
MAAQVTQQSGEAEALETKLLEAVLAASLDPVPAKPR